MIQKTAKESNFNLEDNIIFNLIQKHGIDAQILQTLEEFSELQKELIKNRNRNEDNREQILDEFADVTFMLKQIKMIFNFSNDEIQQKMEEKMTKAAKTL